MKKLLFLLALLVSSSVTAQDGLIGWIDADRIDTFISIYNSPIDTRLEIFDRLGKQIETGSLQAGMFTLTANDALVVGETFITTGSTYILYDIYIDNVTYPDGDTHSVKRHIKPNKPQRR